MKIRIAIIAILSMASAMPMFGGDDLDEVINANDKQKRDYVDGVAMVRPEKSDGEMVVTDFLEIPDKSAADIFASSLLRYVDILDEGEAFEMVDYSKHSFVVRRNYKSGSGSNGIISKKDDMSFTCLIAYKAIESGLMLKMYDVTATFKEKGVIPKKSSLTKLMASDKELYQFVAERFVWLNSSEIAEVLDYVNTYSGPEVTHWKDIARGEVVVGMNEAEVKIIAGNPSSVHGSGNSARWLYDNSFVVIFTNGKVSKVVK